MQGAKLPEERTVDNSKVVKAVPFVQQVLSIFMPGLMFSIILYFTNQIALSLVLGTANVAFLLYLLYQRCGVASQMTYKRGVSFNLRHMLQSPSNLLIQKRGLVSIRYLVENKNKSDRVAERGGISILINTMNRFPYEQSIQNDVLKILRIIGEKSALVRRKIFDTLDCKTELILRISRCKNTLLHNDESRKLAEELEDEEILKNLLFLIGTLIDGSNFLMKQFRLKGLCEVVIELLEKTIAMPKMAYIVCWVLYQSQSGCDETKHYLASRNIFQATLDVLRQNKDDDKLNLMGSMLLFEILFQHVDEGDGGNKSSDGLRFLPDVYAEALEAGVFQALVDLQKRRKHVPQLANMIHVLQKTLTKKRESEVGGMFEIVDM
eukprot:g8322.t1